MFENILQNFVAYGAAAIWVIVLVVWAIWYFSKKNIEDKPEGAMDEFEEDTIEKDSADENTTEDDSAEKQLIKEIKNLDKNNFIYANTNHGYNRFRNNHLRFSGHPRHNHLEAVQKNQIW